MRKMFKLLLLGIIPLMSACAGNVPQVPLTVADYCKLPEEQRALFRAGLIVSGVLQPNWQSVCTVQSNGGKNE